MQSSEIKRLECGDSQPVSTMPLRPHWRGLSKAAVIITRDRNAEKRHNGYRHFDSGIVPRENMQVSRLYRIRILLFGYVIASSAWYLHDAGLALVILLAVWAMHGVAFIAAGRQSTRQQSAALTGMTQRNIRTLDFYLRETRNIACANPNPETGQEMGDRPLGSSTPAHYLRKLMVDTHIPEGLQGETLLDIGCSAGLISAVYTKKNYRLFLMDPDRSGLAAARVRSGGIPLVGSVETLPFNASAFSKIAMLEVIEHLDEPAAALEGIRRILGPGGRFYLTTPNRSGVVLSDLLNPLIVFGKISDARFDTRLIPRSVAWMDAGGDLAYPHTDYLRDEILELLASAGFSVRAVTTFYFLPGLHRVFCRIYPAAKERHYTAVMGPVERVLRRVPIIADLGSNWWIESERHQAARSSPLPDAPRK